MGAFESDFYTWREKKEKKILIISSSSSMFSCFIKQNTKNPNLQVFPYVISQLGNQYRDGIYPAGPVAVRSEGELPMKWLCWWLFETTAAWSPLSWEVLFGQGTNL